MEQQDSDAISVRTTRLNNVILGGGLSYGVSPQFSETLTRECLLDAFCLLYNECAKDALRKRDKNIAEFANKFRSIYEEARQLRVNANDFSVRDLIGQGYFGSVNLVIERHTGDVYAMKKIKKSVITTSQVKEERDIMSRRSSEWITNLQYAFQDTDYLYLVMEYLPGGDLLSLMSRHGPFDEELARFYLAELTLAIHSLHQMGYVHRDIKPENILIDRFGHLKLTDFGNSAALNRDGHVFSLSPVGTPDYIAPELLQTISTYKLTKNMHDVSCDYWSMGIIGYELICEITPFHEENVHETYSKVLSYCEESQLKEIVTFPKEMKVTKDFKNLIENLVTNPSNRLSYLAIRQHPYFEAIDWEHMRSTLPPIIPILQNEYDTSNFDEAHRNKTKAGHGRSAGPDTGPTTSSKKSFTSTMPSNDFNGKDLPFVGYSFVHLERQELEAGALEDARFAKLNKKFKDLQSKYKESQNDITKLKQQLLRAELTAKQSSSQTKILQDAKDEMTKMKNTIKEKNAELANCRTQIKTLQSSLQIEQEMWMKKEATITEVLCLNRQKYEEAKNATEARYEKRIAEKKAEINNMMKKLDEREEQLTAKSDESQRLLEQIDNYKEMLKQHKEQANKDHMEFENQKKQLVDTYEQKLNDLRLKLRHEKDTKSRLTMELRDVRSELDDTIISTRTSEESKQATSKSNDDILRRLNAEIDSNNKLHQQNAELQHKLTEQQKSIEGMQQEIQRLERDLQVIECGRDLTESNLGTQATPYETAPGSLSDIRMIEEQLRADLEAAKEKEITQKSRADKLQQLVEKLEQMLERFNEQSFSPSKPQPAPRYAGGASGGTNGNGGAATTAGDLLEKQNEKLEDKLVAVREQMIVERQAARTANLALWKMEKNLEEVKAEKKLMQRRMELTEERIRKVQGERDEAQRLAKLSEEAKCQRDDRIEELKQEIVNLKRDITKEHRMWEKAEQERMKSRSEMIEHLSHIKKLEEQLLDVIQKMKSAQQTREKFDLENKRLMADINEERNAHSATCDLMAGLQMQLKNLHDNYDRLKYACTITDNQLTEIEAMLENEQKINKTNQTKLDELYAEKHRMDELNNELRHQISDEQIQKQAAETKIRALNNELDEQRKHLEDVQKKMISQQQQLVEQTSTLFATQERFELLQQDHQYMQTLNANHERELLLLKEENAHILTKLFHAKQELSQLQNTLKSSLNDINDYQNELEKLTSALQEKDNFYLQRDIKSEATLAQHKKLIDYLQLKVEDLSQRKKKTLAGKLFGSSHHTYNSSSSSNRKENLPTGVIQASIVYRTLQEELKREKFRCKSLKEQLDKLKGLNSKESTLQITDKHTASGNMDFDCDAKATVCNKTQQSKTDTTGRNVQMERPKTIDSEAKMLQLHHRFELALQEGQHDAENCAACSKAILASTPYWKCKECKRVAHRKCRADVQVACNDVDSIICSGSILDNETSVTKAEPSAPADSDMETISIGKYSYEGKLNADTEGSIASSTFVPADVINSGSTLIFSAQANGKDSSLDILCAYEMEEKNILLLGCYTGLYALQMQTHSLVHIAGIDTVISIAVSKPLTKAILIGSNGGRLYQCDLRHLQSRCQSNACLRPALEASVLDLPFGNNSSSENWLLVEISQETEQPLDTVAIAATATRLVIFKYDIKQQKFKPVQALDTATPVTSIMFTRLTAIVSSDKFFEIDLSTYGAEEFVDVADQSLLHTQSCQPVLAIYISKHEFLLCYMECGVFVDEFGCRSRPYDINWEYTPTGFQYREPFLHISHFQTVQIIRLHRSYSKEIQIINTHKDMDADNDDITPALKRIYLNFYMPTLLCNSGKFNCYTMAIRKDTALQEIYHVDVLQAFKQQLNESLESLMSTATSVTTGSTITTNTDK